MAATTNKSSAGQRATLATAIAVALAIPAEGLRNWAYRDPVGIPTICFGSTRGVQMGDYKSTEQCRTLLGEEMREAVSTVERCIPGLPVKVLAAFADTVFNAGPTIACSPTGSTARKLLLAGKFDDACRQLPRWNKARVAGVLVELPGLTKRRAASMAVCLDWRVMPAQAAPAIYQVPGAEVPGLVRARREFPAGLVSNDYRFEVAA